MTKFSVLVLATLVGAGTAGTAVVFSGEVPRDVAPGATGTQATISSQAAVAWQALRRPKRADPAPQEHQEQAVMRADGFRASTSVATAASPTDPVSLARALQRELKRAGCYHGEINGVWTTSTRQAMKAFTDIANAKLPVTNPDPILLALIQNDQHSSCHERCRQNGRAEPCRDAGVAAASPQNNQSAPAGERTAASLLEPPMALAGPKTPDVDGKVAAPQGPAVRARKHNSHRPAPTEHWSVKLWRESAN